MERRMFAQIDSALTYQDYEPSMPCVRLIGVLEKHFSPEAINSDDGCPTFLIDVPRKTFSERSLSLRRWTSKFIKEIERVPRDIWLEVSFIERARHEGDSYYYELFTDSAPNYIEILSVRFFAMANMVAPPPQYWPPEHSPGRFSLTAFHVGQGMCSLLVGDEHAFFVDLGAGTPIKRAAYPALPKNDISSSLRKLPQSCRISVILSHPDSDHWRLLDWDFRLATGVAAVILPSRIPSLAFKSQVLRGKVFGADDFSVQLGSGRDELRVYRSVPARSDRNGECLVCNIEIDGKKALLSGDYVYRRMATDGHAVLSLMPSERYDAVVVPHHGDRASAKKVPFAKTDQSIAFFSAGNHATYGHPHVKSRQAHNVKGFVEKVAPKLADIVGVQLLP